MVGLGRLELPTSRLSGVRSNHLSYRPQTMSNRKKAAHMGLAVCRSNDQANAHSNERETKTATSRLKCEPKRFFVLKISDGWSGKSQAPQGKFLRKEVIQPQVPLRLPCYDFTPVANPTVVGCLLKG